MTYADPFASLRDRRWAAPLGYVLLAIAAALIVAASFAGGVPFLAPGLSLLAGFTIGLAYQFQPFLHPRRRSPASRKFAFWLVGSSAFIFVAALLVVGLGWAPRAGGLGLVLLGLSVALLLAGLTEFYPEGSNRPGIFLIPVGLDGLMLQSFAPLWSAPAQFVTAIALFVPGTGAAVVLTVWAFRVRGVDKASYAKATETARGVLWAWTLLVIGVLVWTWFGIKFSDSTWMNPILWGLPLVTVGSVLATATAGWSKYVEARAEIEQGHSASIS